MKSEQEIRDLLSATNRKLEQEMDIKISNGQGREGIMKALRWVLR